MKPEFNGLTYRELGDMLATLNEDSALVARGDHATPRRAATDRYAGSTSLAAPARPRGYGAFTHRAVGAHPGPNPRAPHRERLSGDAARLLSERLDGAGAEWAQRAGARGDSGARSAGWRGGSVARSAQSRHRLRATCRRADE